MTDKKALAISRVISETNVETEQLIHLLKLMGKLTAEDALKDLWLAMGAATTLKNNHT